MIRVLLSWGIALLVYVAVDILLWQRIFETNELKSYSTIYFLGWQHVLYGLIILGAILLLPDWKWSVVYAVGLYCLAHSGLEDVLYYWIDGKAIPESLPWLDYAPLILFKPVTSESLIASTAVWLVMILSVVFLIKEVEILYENKRGINMTLNDLRIGNLGDRNGT